MVLEPGYEGIEVQGTMVLEPGYEGSNIGGTRVCKSEVRRYDGISAGVRGN